MPTLVVVHRAPLLVLLPLLISSAFAQSNDDCLTCHAEAVDPAAFAASVHGELGLECVGCHAALAGQELPHGEKVAPVDCGTCHETEVAEYRASVHGQAREAGRTLAATCTSCHGTHDIRRSKDPESHTYHLNLLRTCGQCHGNSETIASAKLGGGNVVQLFEDSIHGRALVRGGLLVAPSCSSCHGVHAIRPKQDPQSRVARANVPATCGGCHEGVKLKFDRGRHGQLLQQNNPAGPVCIDCHSAHHIQPADLPAWQLDVVRECGTCHHDSIASFRDTFHGQVTALGYRRVASCADCHGAHEVLPASDPRSPISAANRVETCRKCHPAANANFARYDPHADRHRRERNPALYWASRSMELLLAAVFGFFGLHTAMWMARSWWEVSRGPR
ncbi:MAG TPA: cytochrome c3 family protein [Candidatus Polarisedimenticolaceae bacterium]|nr:cytochrome c3 family protein [Candidatus Polarisedimenticolaceae bacterium]